MLCPFCLGETEFDAAQVAMGGQQRTVSVCPGCKEPSPGMYLRDYRRFPPVVVSTIGFTSHGKSVLLGSVFHSLMHRRLGEQWPGFNWLAVNEQSLDHVMEIVDTLRAGDLPEATQQVFAKPTLVRLRGVPHHPDCTLLWYDAAGESFEHASQLVNYASFVARARCVMFLISLPDCAASPRGTAVEMHRLLNTYLLGRAELGGQPREQHLIVTFTKGDTLPQIAPDWATGWLDDDDDYSPASHHLRELRETSRYLRRFVAEELQADQFLAIADESFRSVEFSVVSALGAAPVDDKRQSQQMAPWRVLDPLLWTIVKSTPSWRRWLHRIAS